VLSPFYAKYCYGDKARRVSIVHTACMEREKRNACRISLGKGEMQFGRQH
jgi:hypothetical protein